MHKVCNMITLVPAHTDLHPPREAGAFAWWYVDLVDEAGDGVVLIWGFALPFLDPPGDAPALQQPFVNLCLYERGRLACYHLERLPPEAARLDGDAWILGGSRLRSARRGDRWIVEVDLDLPIAGAADRLRGEVRAEGPAVHFAPDALAAVEPGPPGPHRWAPLTVVARGEARFERETGWRWARSGRAYHDRNTGDRPMTRFGIREWAWGRLALPDAELVHYVCWPEADAAPARAMAVRVEADGAARVEAIDPIAATGRLGLPWGFRAPTAFPLPDLAGGQVDVRAGGLVDESPFYLRFPLAAAGAEGAIVGRGWGERVRPANIGLSWMKPFVRMRVRAPGEAHALLPLFAGPREDRVRRALSWWAS